MHKHQPDSIHVDDLQQRAVSPDPHFITHWVKPTRTPSWALAVVGTLSRTCMLAMLAGLLCLLLAGYCIQVGGSTTVLLLLGIASGLGFGAGTVAGVVALYIATRRPITPRWYKNQSHINPR